MSALCLIEHTDFDAVREKRDAIVTSVRTHAERHNLGKNPIQSCVDCAVAIWRTGRSPAYAIAEGKALADRIARECEPRGAA